MTKKTTPKEESTKKVEVKADPKKLHVKPTKDELDNGIKKSLEEAEALKDKPDTPEEPEKPKETPKEPKKPEIDYKTKFKASTQESQILHARNKQVNEALEKAASIPDPTEEEMRAEYLDWEEMSDFEKKMAIESIANKRRIGAITEVTQKFKDLDRWQKDVKKFVGDPTTLVKHPKLEGRTDEFEVFATKPTRRGVDFDDLISAFLFEAETKQPKHKGKMFEEGSGGPAEKPKQASNKITMEQARALRKTDYNKYKRYLKEGRIEADF